MGYKDENRDRRRPRRASAPAATPGAPSGGGHEKHRARELRQSAWWRKKTAAGKCHYCGTIVGHAGLTMDHIIPLSRGGTSERFNIVPACKDCNNKKSYLLPAEWDDYLESIKNTPR
ncbi:MAG: HNH endonuclease [Spirochaetes bacterium]|nr:MAG: HNH endonuclease [Spirochaetota bacterium]